MTEPKLNSGANVKVHLFNADGKELRYYENVSRHGVSDGGTLYLLTDTQRVTFQGSFLIEEDK